MEESSEIVTFGPRTRSEDEQSTGTQNTTESFDENVENSQHKRNEYRPRVENTDFQNMMEMFRGQMSDFNRSLMRGFDQMTGQIESLVGVMNRKIDEIQNAPEKQNIARDESLETDLRSVENRHVVHSTPNFVRDVNSNHWREPVHEKSKIKPQNFDGKDDLEEYLAQFELISELNNWTYKNKSLYLASSLTGDARGLLNELNENERRDFEAIVLALKSRFGSVNKAEVFRSELQTRIKGKNESIPELAQSIKKLTRKAYPGASLDVIETLALDYFIDAIPFRDIRIRLREVCPKTVSEAEKIAVRLDAVHIADKSRNCNIKSVGLDTGTSEFNRKIDDVLTRIDNMSDEIKILKGQNRQNFQQNPRRDHFRSQNQDSRPRFRYGQNNSRYRRDDQRQEFPVRPENDNRNFYDDQGNFQRSTQGGRNRPVVPSPEQQC